MGEKLDKMDKPDKFGRKMKGEEMKKKMQGKDLEGDFKGMKEKMAKKPQCADKSTPTCTGGVAPLDKKAIGEKMMGELLCPADKKAPKCADASTPKVSDADKKSKERPVPKCTDGTVPVCTGGVATVDKKTVMA